MDKKTEEVGQALVQLICPYVGKLRNFSARSSKAGSEVKVSQPLLGSVKVREVFLVQ